MVFKNNQKMEVAEFEKNIINFNEQLTIDRLNYFDTKKFSNTVIDSVIICGMGGSGLAGRILQGIGADLNIPVPILVWSDYDLPKHPYKNPLYIFVSFSGDTAETLSGLQRLNILKFKNVAVITSGGKLLKLAQEAGLPRAIFNPQTLQPRQSTGLIFYGLLGLLKNVFPNIKIIELNKTLKPEENRSNGSKLAKKLAKKIVLVYTETNNSYLAYNWKDRLNETGKALCFFNTVPEMCHNEIVSFENQPNNVINIFLRDFQDHPENKKRFNIIARLTKQRGVDSLNIELSGRNLFEKIFNSINLADWAAFYLAINNDLSPADIKIIDQLKKLMV